MIITIKISKRLADHLESPHLFYDECEEACDVLKKVQKEIDNQNENNKRN